MNLNQNRNHNIKTSKQLERHFKGIANHRRIDVLMLVNKKSGLTLDQICKNINCNYQTLAEHVARLTNSGLISKRNKGNNVEHRVTTYGQMFCNFIDDFMWS